MKTGFVLWFTGLSGSGKSTLAARLADRLAEEGIHVESLDGDEVRKYLSYGLGFSREDRDQNVRRIGFVARVAARSGACAITAAISPYRAIRDEVRALTPRFCEVYCECPIEVLASRDPKGLYKKALAGEIKNFTGVDDPYEAPLAPEVHLRTDQQTPDECEAAIVSRLRELGYLGGEESTVQLPPPYGGELVGVPARPLDPAAQAIRIEVGQEELDASVAMALGYLSPVCGFMSERELEKVHKVQQLERGFSWPTPQVLEVGREHHALPVGTQVVLTHQKADVAELTVLEVQARGERTVLAGSLRAVSSALELVPSAADVRKRAAAAGLHDALVVVETGAPEAPRLAAARSMARAARGLILLTTPDHERTWQDALGALERVVVTRMPPYLLRHQEFWEIAAQNVGGSRVLTSVLTSVVGA
jgi:adenylyl-sulfate kinase